MPWEDPERSSLRVDNETESRRQRKNKMGSKTTRFQTNPPSCSPLLFDIPSQAALNLGFGWPLGFKK